MSALLEVMTFFLLSHLNATAVHCPKSSSFSFNLYFSTFQSTKLHHKTKKKSDLSGLRALFSAAVNLPIFMGWGR